MNKLFTLISDLWSGTDWFAPLVIASPWVIMLIAIPFLRNAEEERRIASVSECWNYYGALLVIWVIAPLSIVLAVLAGTVHLFEWLTRPRKFLAADRLSTEPITWTLEQICSDEWVLYGRTPSETRLRWPLTSRGGLPPSDRAIRKAKKKAIRHALRHKFVESNIQTI